MKSISKTTGKIFSAALAATVALALSPVPSAFALGTLTTWTAPTSKTSNTITKDGKTYTYVTSAGHRITEAAGDMLGISNTTVDPTKGNPFKYAGTAQEIYEAASTTARIGVFGSDVNENPNPYYANYFYNAYQDAKGSSDKADSKYVFTIQTGNLSPAVADTYVKTEYGTSPSLYKRPDILFGAAKTGKSSYLTVTSTGENTLIGDALTTTSGYSELVAKIRNKELGNDPDGNSLYQAGDESYNPYYVSYYMFDVDSNSSYNNVTNMYNLATAAQAVIDRSANTSTPKTTRYGDVTTIAEEYEAYLRGMQYAIQQAIATGKVTKKTVGVVSSLDAETGAVTFCNFDTGTTAYTSNSRIAESVENVTDNITTVDNLADNVGTAKDVMACSKVFLSSADQKDTLVQMLKNAGYTDESKYPDIFTTGPKPVLQIGAYSPENAQNFGYAMGFVYPEVINPVHALAYFYETFYHVKHSRLADALGINLASMSLPKGCDLNIDSYTTEGFEATIGQGLAYYAANKASIDSAYPKLTATDTLQKTLIADAVVATTPVAQTIKASNVTKTYSANKKNVLAANKTFSVKATAKTKVTFAKKSGNAKITVTKAGKVTVKKGLKKGTYKAVVKATAAASSTYGAAYKAATKNITVTVKVK